MEGDETLGGLWIGLASLVQEGKLKVTAEMKGRMGQVKTTNKPSRTESVSVRQHMLSVKQDKWFSKAH